MLPSLLALALAPALVAAGLFPKGGKVQMLDAKDWKSTLSEDRAVMVAFVAPWCGHCQKLVPEYTKVAHGLSPLVPFYAVDCDADANKQLCAKQGVKGFPTIKMFPRGLKLSSIEYDKERVASAMFYWVSKSIPGGIERVRKPEGISTWKFDNRESFRAILLNKKSKIPLLWKVLGNKYNGKIKFANVRDKKGRVSKALGFAPGEKEESKVVVFRPNDRDGILFKGVMKHEQLQDFLDHLLAGDIDLSEHQFGDEQIVLAAEKEARDGPDDTPGNKPIGADGEIGEDDEDKPDRDEL